MKIPSEKELFQAGVHFGHKPSSWHPKMSDFIYGQKNNVHIIDLTQTKKHLESALELIKTIAAEGKQILFVGTRMQSKKLIAKYAQEVHMPYINERWLGGTLTNFKTIYGLVKKLNQLEEQAKGENYAKKYTKKERSEFAMEIERLNEMIGGIRNMHELPGAIFIASARYEKTAVSEANKKEVPSVAICDTNANPQKITHPIPANDDASKSIELIVSLIAEAIKEGTKGMSSRSAQGGEGSRNN